MPTANWFFKILARPPGRAGVRTQLASQGSSGHPQWASLGLTLKVVEVFRPLGRPSFSVIPFKLSRPPWGPCPLTAVPLSCRLACTCRTHEFGILHLMTFALSHPSGRCVTSLFESPIFWSIRILVLIESRTTWKHGIPKSFLGLL